jgi:CheY-like chemotaxis protein
MLLEPPKQCLIVDDTRSTRVMLDHWLTLAGFSCKNTQNGRDAKESIERTLPDILITDIEMPLFNGLELVCWIRRNPNEKIAVIPIVVVTGLDDPDLEKVVSEIGTNFVLRKPLFEEATLKMVMAAMSADEAPSPSQPKVRTHADPCLTPSQVRQMADDAKRMNFKNGPPQ